MSEHPKQSPMSRETIAIIDVLAEYRKACQKFAPFHSGHEGYAVLLEETDELWDALTEHNPTLEHFQAYHKIRTHLDNLWSLVKTNNPTRDEAVQVAAMALRFIVDVCDKDQPVIKEGK